MPGSCCSRLVPFALLTNQFTAFFVLMQGKQEALPLIKDNMKQFIYITKAINLAFFFRKCHHFIQ